MRTNSLQNSQDHQEKETNILDFRAPPPSPIGSSRRASSVANDEVLSDFLEHSLRVPDLILPDRIFPRQQSLGEIPLIDFKALSFIDDGLVMKIRDSLAEFGCFQVINHGISPKLVGPVVRRGGRIFRMLPEMKKMAVRSSEMEFGFEEVSGEQEEVVSEMSEEFVWGKSCGFKLKMEGILPAKYSKFSEKMETLASAIEKVAKDIMLVLSEDFVSKIPKNGDEEHDDHNNMNDCCVCHIYKHPHDVPIDQCISALRYDVIRMMIRGSDYSHALGLHVCDGSSEFHVYSKKGWISFVPLENALIVTVGDLIQGWSGGRYNHVIGKPIYTSRTKDCISLAFLYSPHNQHTLCNKKNVEEELLLHHKADDHQKKEKMISLRQQALFAIVFTIACQFIFHIYCRLSHP